MNQKEIFDYLRSEGYTRGEALYFSGRVLKFDPALREAFERYATTGEKPDFCWKEWSFDSLAERTSFKQPRLFFYMDNLMRDPEYADYIRLGFLGEE